MRYVINGISIYSKFNLFRAIWNADRIVNYIEINLLMSIINWNSDSNV
jgi:hypothetical protein